MAPGAPAPLTPEVAVWVVPLDGPDTHRDEAACSPGERARATAFRQERDGRRSLRAHGALRRILAASSGVNPRALAFDATCKFCGGPHGKPRLVGPPGAGLCFSLAHAGEVALVAVAAGHEVGIDLEDLRPMEDPELVGAPVLSPGELAAVRQAEPARRPAAFFAAWTRKEAYAKARGFGLVPPPGEPALPEVDLGPLEGVGLVHAADGTAWTVQPLEVPGLAAALCVAGPVPARVRLRRRST